MDTPADCLSPLLLLRGASPPAPPRLTPLLAAGAKVPKPPDVGGHLADMSGDLGDLRAQRWGVVITNDDRGEHLLSLVQPLVARRAEQQRAPLAKEAPPVKVYRVAPGMTAEQAAEFVRGPYQNEVADVRQRPAYLLILGDADGVSWELQRILSLSGLFPGRLAFDADDDYRAYVDKVIAWEQKAVAARPARYFAVHDGTGPVATGLSGFLRPSRQALAAKDLGPSVRLLDADVESHTLATLEEREAELKAMLASASDAPGGLLVSLSHGLGLDGGATVEQRRAEQGALALSLARALRPEEVAARPFFEGGAWFFFACFSAGTPRETVYRPWMEALVQRGYLGKGLDYVTSALPSPPSPFVAALPKAALASPRGPVAVMGHVDLAWTWSFSPETGLGSSFQRHARFTALFEALLQGRRFGAALHELTSAGAAVGQGLLAMDGGPSAAQDPSDIHAAERAYRWLEMQDLGAFVLLGDPAARLPMTPGEQALEAAALAAAKAATAPAAPDGPPSPELLRLEGHVIASLPPGEDIESHAGDAGQDPADFKEMVRAYREAGRRALAAVLAERKKGA
jgi:hypothetical protein